MSTGVDNAVAWILAWKLLVVMEILTERCGAILGLLCSWFSSIKQLHRVHEKTAPLYTLP